MSVWILPNSHINYLVNAARLSGLEHTDDEGWQHIGQMLMNANMETRERKHHKGESAPVFVYSPRETFDYVAVISALQCYRYQVDQFGNWFGDHEAFCNALLWRMADYIDDQNHVPWVLEENRLEAYERGDYEP